MHYGLGTANPSEAATGAATITAASAEEYTWGTDPTRRKAFVIADPDYTGRLYGWWNAASDPAPTTDWDFVLDPGDYAESPDGIVVGSVRIYAETANATYKAHFQVRGWD